MCVCWNIVLWLIFKKNKFKIGIKKYTISFLSEATAIVCCTRYAIIYYWKNCLISDRQNSHYAINEKHTEAFLEIQQQVIYLLLQHLRRILCTIKIYWKGTHMRHHQPHIVTKSTNKKVLAILCGGGLPQIKNKRTTIAGTVSHLYLSTRDETFFLLKNKFSDDTHTQTHRNSWHRTMLVPVVVVVPHIRLCVYVYYKFK